MNIPKTIEFSLIIVLTIVLLCVYYVTRNLMYFLFLLPAIIFPIFIYYITNWFSTPNYLI